MVAMPNMNWMGADPSGSAFDVYRWYMGGGNPVANTGGGTGIMQAYQPTTGAGGDGPSPYSALDQKDFSDYKFNAQNYGPGGKYEINPAALGMSFFEQPGSGKVKDQGFIQSIIGAGVPNKMTAEFRTPTGIQPRGPAELGFMTKEIEGLPGSLTRDQLRAMYDNYSKFKGRGSRYGDAKVKGTLENLFGMIPGVGTAKKGLEAIFGPQGNRSMQSTYAVDNVGFGNTGARDEFGLSVVDDNKRWFGKKDRDYLDRMEDRTGELTDFFSGKRKKGGKWVDSPKAKGIENFAEQWANWDNLEEDEQQSLFDKMKAINSVSAKQMLAYKNRIATEKINRDWKKQQEDIATKKKIKSEKDFVTQDLGVTAADAATSGRGMDHTAGMTARERGAAASRMGGGSRQAKSGSQKSGGSGRKDSGWGWAEGGMIDPDLSKDPEYLGWKKVYKMNPELGSMHEKHPTFIKFYKKHERDQKKFGGLAGLLYG